MKVDKMGEYFSFRAKHKMDQEKRQERRRVPTGAQNGGGMRNYKRLAKQKRKRFKSVEQPATKSEKLQSLEAKVRESQLDWAQADATSPHGNFAQRRVLQSACFCLPLL